MYGRSPRLNGGSPLTIRMRLRLVQQLSRQLGMTLGKAARRQPGLDHVALRPFNHLNGCRILGHR